MFTRDLDVDGFSAEDWIRLGRVFRPPGADTLISGSLGGVIAVASEQRLRKLVHTKKGRIPLDRQPWPVPLAELAGAQGARWAAEIQFGALDELSERFARTLRPEHEYLDQLLNLLEVIRDLEVKKAICTWPRSVRELPVLSPISASRVLDMLCPEGRVLLLGVFSRGALFTAMAARRRGFGFDRICGPEPLRAEMGLLSGDWRRDHRHLKRAVERLVGPLAVGLYGTLWSLQRLSVNRAAGSWAAAVASRDIILYPVVAALAVPLSLDAGRAAFHALRDLTGSFGDLLGRSGPLGPALERVYQLTARPYDFRHALGFDPLELFGRLMTWLSREGRS